MNIKNIDNAYFCRTPEEYAAVIEMLHIRKYIGIGRQERICQDIIIKENLPVKIGVSSCMKRKWTIRIRTMLTTRLFDSRAYKDYKRYLSDSFL